MMINNNKIVKNNYIFVMIVLRWQVFYRAAAYQPCKHLGTGDWVTKTARPISVQLFASKTITPAWFSHSDPPQMIDDKTTPSSSSCVHNKRVHQKQLMIFLINILYIYICIVSHYRSAVFTDKTAVQ